MASDPAIPASARRGRPRSTHAEQAILKATTEILEERGFPALTMEEVATRAGVGKATVYRWWSSKGTLAFDAFLARFLESQPLPDTGSLRGDLLAALRAWIRTVKGTATGLILAGLVAEVQRDPRLADEWRERFVGVVRDHHRIMLERAIERSEIPPHCDTDVVLDLLYGSAYHRLLQSHLPLTDRFARGVVDIIVDGLTIGNGGT
ncbi:MAG TPA: TetR/AcrR family transcriptional regulator [Acidimicrobiales bacterium]